ncbi:MAG: acyl-CoA dehydrogenase family protein [Dehalococcoidia bacterium]|nr:acyl-CoA dehydrogenase family protein [Dehalococcoidia bacterium]
MDFRDDAGQLAWRQEIRQFLKDEDQYVPRGDIGEGTWRDNPQLVPWRKRLATRGWIAPAWPKEYGGASLGVMEQFIMNEEFAEAEVTSVFDTGVLLVGPTLIVHGSEEQRAEHLPKILEGDIQWCQGFSEPEAGSDLAGLQTRAVRDGDDWVINGQKIWTSYAHLADWIFMLARTDPAAPKHRGITMFLLDMKTPGVSVRPLVNVSGKLGFNETFFEDVRVPAKNVVGEVNRGWYISTTTLDFERSAVGAAVGVRKRLERYIRYINEHRNDGTVTYTEAMKTEIADRWIEAATARLLSYRVASMQAQGLVPNAEASISKVFSSELEQRVARTAMHIVGPYGMVLAGGRAPLGGAMPGSYLGTLGSTIAGGTSEIQRNIIATRGLSLPRG